MGKEADISNESNADGSGEAGPRQKLGIDAKMLELLVCPLTHGNLKLSIKTEELISVKAKLAYPVRGGIPIMLPSEAREMDEDELAEYDS